MIGDKIPFEISTLAIRPSAGVSRRARGKHAIINDQILHAWSMENTADYNKTKQIL